MTVLVVLNIFGECLISNIRVYYTCDNFNPKILKWTNYFKHVIHRQNVHKSFEKNLLILFKTISHKAIYMLFIIVVAEHLNKLKTFFMLIDQLENI